MPDLTAAPFVLRGQLIEALTDFVDSQVGAIYAIMLPERHRLPKVKACAAFWAEWLLRFAGAQKAD